MAQSGYDGLVRLFLIRLSINGTRVYAELEKIDQLKHAAIPISFSEYSNSAYQPRLFQETKALYSLQMSQVFSGGCVYEM